MTHPQVLTTSRAYSQASGLTTWAPRRGTLFSPLEALQCQQGGSGWAAEPKVWAAALGGLSMQPP